MVYIGIDPDCTASGFSVWDKSEKKFILLKTLDLTDLFFEITIRSHIIKEVRLEAGHLKKGTWHKGGVGMAKKVGANHEIGRQIEKFLIKTKIPYQLILPQGYSGWSHERFVAMTGYVGRTNPETRVAGMLVYGL